MNNHKICTIENCIKRLIFGNVCEMHYRRFKTHGDYATTMLSRGTGETREARFWSRVSVTANPEKCWEWQGRCNANGYGQVGWKGKNQLAHRIAYEMHNGITPSLCVLHSCDNRKCVNPNHLRQGTRLDNSQDAISRGRNARGETAGNSKLTLKNVLEIKQLHKEGTKVADLAKRFNVVPNTIYCVTSGATWKHAVPQSQDFTK